MRESPKDPQIARLIAELDFEEFELYHLFAHRASFQAVAEDVHRAPNTVRDRMIKMSKLFESLTGHALLDATAGTYRLTMHGEHMAQKFPSLIAWTSELLSDHKNEHRTYEVPCTSVALGLLSELQHALADLHRPAEFVLLPKAVKTAELQLYGEKNSGYPFALGSVLLNGDDVDTSDSCPLVVRRGPLEIHVVRNDPIYLLAPKALGLPKNVDLRADVLHSGITVVMPEGGAVWKFLQEMYGDWQVQWPHQFMDVPHLDYAVKVLLKKAVPRAAIVVHGDLGELKSLVPDTALHRFKDPKSMKHRAITGLIVDRSADVQTVDLELVLSAAANAFGRSRSKGGMQ